jgi:hypothetical protein
LRWTAGALLAVLAWQGREILGRLDTLERNQTKILVHLGIPPVGRDTLDFGVKNRDFATLPTIEEIKSGCHTLKNWAQSP